LVGFAVAGCDAATPRLALMTEAEPCSDGVQMAQEHVPRVSLLSLASRVIFLNLDVSAGIDVPVVIVKSR